MILRMINREYVYSIAVYQKYIIYHIITISWDRYMNIAVHGK